MKWLLCSVRSGLGVDTIKAALAACYACAPCLTAGCSWPYAKRVGVFYLYITSQNRACDGWARIDTFACMVGRAQGWYGVLSFVAPVVLPVAPDRPQPCAMHSGGCLNDFPQFMVPYLRYNG